LLLPLICYVGCCYVVDFWIPVTPSRSPFAPVWITRCLDLVTLLFVDPTHVTPCAPLVGWLLVVGYPWLLPLHSWFPLPMPHTHSYLYPFTLAPVDCLDLIGLPRLPWLPLPPLGLHSLHILLPFVYLPVVPCTLPLPHPWIVPTPLHATPSHTPLPSHTHIALPGWIPCPIPHLDFRFPHIWIVLHGFMDYTPWITHTPLGLHTPGCHTYPHIWIGPLTLTHILPLDCTVVTHYVGFGFGYPWLLGLVALRLCPLDCRIYTHSLGWVTHCGERCVAVRCCALLVGPRWVPVVTLPLPVDCVVVVTAGFPFAFSPWFVTLRVGCYALLPLPIRLLCRIWL